MRRAMPLLTGVALLLGLAHLGLSALAWRSWSAEVLWFAGSGLAIILAGLFNVAMIRATAVDRVQKAVWVFANLAAALFFVAAWSVLAQPQVVVGGVVFALLGLAAAGTRSDRARA